MEQGRGDLGCDLLPAVEQGRGRWGSGDGRGEQDGARVGGLASSGAFPAGGVDEAVPRRSREWRGEVRSGAPAAVGRA
uniref:Uncharacterized protein n=1 Tax=Arundo donax TaxID=35708 RepID=A0A0A9DQ39_ARUDO